MTNLAVYLLSTNKKTCYVKSFFIKNGGIVERRIPIEKIMSISISKKSFEFVLHVPSEYDQRFQVVPEAPTKVENLQAVKLRNRFMEAITEAHLAKTRKKTFRFYYHNRKNLVNYVKKKSDAK